MDQPDIYELIFLAHGFITFIALFSKPSLARVLKEWRRVISLTVTRPITTSQTCDGILQQQIETMLVNMELSQEESEAALQS